MQLWRVMHRRKGLTGIVDHPAKYFPELKNTTVNKADFKFRYNIYRRWLSGNFQMKLLLSRICFNIFKHAAKDNVGTARQYSNPSIGLMGYITALALKRPYSELIEKHFTTIGNDTKFYSVPEQQMSQYAWGYKMINPFAFLLGCWMLKLTE